jgi:hypothetical protein
LCTPLEGKEKKTQKATTTGTPSISRVIQASHFAPPRRSSAPKTDNAEQAIGQAVVGLVNVITKELQTKPSRTPWDPSAPATFASCVVSACAKGTGVLEAQLKAPHLYSLPNHLVPLIRDYVAQHPILHELHQQPELAQRLKKTLCANQLEELHKLYGMPVLDNKTKQIETNQEKSSCLVM